MHTHAQCGLHEWTEEQTKAWNWLWDKVALAFVGTLFPLENDQVALVWESWEQVRVCMYVCVCLCVYVLLCSDPCL